MTRLHCALCGRRMGYAAVWIGQEPIGPKCASRAGLLTLTGRTGSRVKLFAPARRIGDPSRNLDLFEELAE